jgi:MYXO-CTERM domain-containing protein
VGGKCQQQCSTSGDCAPDYECQGKSCVAVGDAAVGGSGGGGGNAGSAGTSPSTGGSPSGGKSGSSDGGDDGGCGCTTPRAGQRGLGALVLLALGVVARRRRRA